MKDTKTRTQTFELKLLLMRYEAIIKRKEKELILSDGRSSDQAT